MNLNILDIIFIFIVILLSARVALRGFVEEFMSFAAFILAIVSALLFSSMLEPYVDRWLNTGAFNHVVAFLVIFLVVYLLIKIFERLIKTLLEKLALDNLDRALGLFLGFFEGLVIISVLILILYRQPFFDVSSLLHDSKISGLVIAVLPMTFKGF